jgi:hypothetical protein
MRVAAIWASSFKLQLVTFVLAMAKTSFTSMLAQTKPVWICFPHAMGQLWNGVWRPGISMDVAAKANTFEFLHIPLTRLVLWAQLHDLAFLSGIMFAVSPHLMSPWPLLLRLDQKNW